MKESKVLDGIQTQSGDGQVGPIRKLQQVYHLIGVKHGEVSSSMKTTVSFPFHCWDFSNSSTATYVYMYQRLKHNTSTAVIVT